AAREAGMLRASRSCAQLQATAGGPATYIGLFAQKHPYATGVELADQDPQTIGAYHTADVPYWFQTFDAFNLFRRTRDWQPADTELSDRMLDSLVALAKTGSPQHSTVQWPAWSARSEQYLEMAHTDSVRKLATKRMNWLAAHSTSDNPLTPPPPGHP